MYVQKCLVAKSKNVDTLQNLWKFQVCMSCNIWLHGQQCLVHKKIGGWCVQECLAGTYKECPVCTSKTGHAQECLVGVDGTSKTS